MPYNKITLLLSYILLDLSAKTLRLVRRLENCKRKKKLQSQSSQQNLYITRDKSKEKRARNTIERVKIIFQKHFSLVNRLNIYALFIGSN